MLGEQGAKEQKARAKNHVKSGNIRWFIAQNGHNTQKNLSPEHAEKSDREDERNPGVEKLPPHQSMGGPERSGDDKEISKKSMGHVNDDMHS